MRNLGVEVTAESLNDVTSLFDFDLFHQTFKCFVTFQNARFGELAQWHFFGIVTDFFHLIGHHLHIEHQLDQILNGLVQVRLYFRLVIFFLCLLLLLGCVIFFIILFVVHLNLSISSPQFIIQFSMVFMGGMCKMIVGNEGLLAWNTYSSPTCEEIVFMWCG